MRHDHDHDHERSNRGSRSRAMIPYKEFQLEEEEESKSFLCRLDFTNGERREVRRRDEKRKETTIFGANSSDSTRLSMHRASSMVDGELDAADIYRIDRRNFVVGHGRTK